MPSACSIRPRSIRERRSRRGSVYVLVLGTALAVTILGLSAVAIARIQLQADALTTDVEHASILALSATERAVSVVSSEPTWRDTHTHGTETSPRAFGGGTISYRLLDLGADKDLQTTQAIRVEGIGRVGDAVRVHSVEMSGDVPLSCLGATVHAGGDLVISGADIVCDQLISTNGSCTASTANVYSEVEARGDITGTAYHDAVRSFGDGRALPDPATVFDYYVTNGTPIAVTDLSFSGGYRQIHRVVLSPKNNPYGTGLTNPEGIYVIDCQGEPVNIQRGRIVGTLVLLDTPDARIINTVHMEPAVPDYPVLMVQGPLGLKYTSTDMLDEGWEGMNFNPPGAPYRGEVDDDAVDLLDCMIAGLVYATGNMTHESTPVRVDGVLVTDGVFESKYNPLELNYDARFVRSPPPGFRAAAGPIKTVPGTWRWEPAP